MTKPRRTEIRKIESLNARNVCFSKRRSGLFKKAEELKRINPNIYVTAVAFSPAGKPFVYGDPDSVLHSFLSPSPLSDLPRHHHDLLSVDISRLNKAELESYANHLQILRSRLISDNNGSTVSFPESGVNSEFLNFPSRSGPVFRESNIADTNIGFVKNFDSGLNTEFLNFPSGAEILGEDVGNIIDTNIGFESFSDSGLNSEFNFRSGLEIVREGFVSKLGADFESNIDINSVSFSESGVINSELVGFSSEVVGDDSRLWSGSGIDLDFNIEDFNISELDAQIMDSDDFLNLSELGFGFEPKEDKVVSFGNDIQPKMDIGVEEDEIEAVLREFLNEGNDNGLNSVF